MINVAPDSLRPLALVLRADNATGSYDGGFGVACRLYDMRQTFATRFALAGGSLPVLAKIRGHADSSSLMRYVHPSQGDMDRAMEWYNGERSTAAELDEMLLESQGGRQQAAGVDGPPFRPPLGKRWSNFNNLQLSQQAERKAEHEP
jgi:hypothetical protein